jgi:hypothetical protein
MKNHFFIGYAGNKRNEVDNIYKKIQPTLKNIKYIVEPYCGTSALSYYISLHEPNKYKYILNDNNKYLIELYKVASSKKKLNKLINKLNILLKDINKEKYKIIINSDTLEGWIIKNKIYAIRAGLFPTTRKIIESFEYLNTCPMIDFLRTEDITFYNMDAIELYEKFKDNKEALIFLDPPYINTCNDFYKCASMNIYEYLNDNDIQLSKANIILCLENNWIILLLFKKYIIDEYKKTYETSKKKTTHLLISNNKKLIKV